MQELVGGWDVGGGGNLSEAGVLNWEQFPERIQLLSSKVNIPSDWNAESQRCFWQYITASTTTDDMCGWKMIV